MKSVTVWDLSGKKQVVPKFAEEPTAVCLDSGYFACSLCKDPKTNKHVQVASRKSDFDARHKLEKHATNLEELKHRCPFPNCHDRDYATLQLSNLHTHFRTRQHLAMNNQPCREPGCDWSTSDVAALSRHHSKAHGKAPDNKKVNESGIDMDFVLAEARRQWGAIRAAPADPSSSTTPATIRYEPYKTTKRTVSKKKSDRRAPSKRGSPQKRKVDFNDGNSSELSSSTFFSSPPLSSIGESSSSTFFSSPPSSSIGESSSSTFFSSESPPLSSIGLSSPSFSPTPSFSSLSSTPSLGFSPSPSSSTISLSTPSPLFTSLSLGPSGSFFLEGNESDFVDNQDGDAIDIGRRRMLSIAELCAPSPQDYYPFGNLNVSNDNCHIPPHPFFYAPGGYGN